MYYLQNIHLKNFCGYKNCSLLFSQNKKHNPISVFYGPNGEGKSSVLQAIRLVSNPYQFFGRENDMFFRKLTFQKNYDPTAEGYVAPENNLLIKAEYVDIDGKTRSSTLDSKGMVESCLKRYNSDQEGWSLYCDVDHPINMNKFQLYTKNKDLFINLAKDIYEFDVELDKKVESEWVDKTTREVIQFYQNFILNKKDAKIHFRRMSDGEKKIATLLRFLCDEIVFNPSKIILIDNIEMHIYFKRHAMLVDKLTKLFPDRQFIVTTHSQTLIEHVSNKFGDHCLYDLETINKNS
jgi:predicted ATP-binding protein involved in virulence